jgi:micrococcal nuclease
MRKVVRVLDGESLLLTSGAGVERYRLAGVDTLRAVRRDRRTYGFEAGCERFLAGLVRSGDVQIEYEADKPTKDPKGRILIYLYWGDMLINREMLAEGYGRVSRGYDGRFKEAFEQAEGEAAIGRRGYWMVVNPWLPARPSVWFPRDPLEMQRVFSGDAVVPTPPYVRRRLQ